MDTWTGVVRPCVTAALVLAALGAGMAQAAPCVVPDNGGGTVTLPPPGCSYLSPMDLHEIVDGLPPGTTIQLSPIHRQFVCGSTPSSVCSVPMPPGTCQTPGGTLGGDQECAESSLTFLAQGTGALAGYNRTINVPVSFETHTGPRIPGDPVQSFDTDMFRLFGQLPPGDPDFDLLRVTAGTNFGMPSPGHTTLTQLPGGNWNVDSFFDITYRIDFIGSPGGPLAGASGSTVRTIRMGTGEPAPPLPCTVQDNGSGTVTLPPAGCDYLSPDEVHQIVDGLPPGTTIELAAIHTDFICHEQGTINPICTFTPPFPGVDCDQPGGTLGGQQECAGSTLELDLTGTGALAGFQRQLDIPVHFETHTAPRTPGDPVQSFDTEMFRLGGQLPPGDPDFDLLRITAGSGFGLPSPGHTTLMLQPGGSWAVDSFFDITYRIDFVGSPGGPLAGMAGSTNGTIHMETPTSTCPPIPAGNDVFPSTAKLVVQMLGPGSEPFVLRMSDVGLGPTVITREPQLGDVIETELVQLQLRGNHPVLGPVVARAGSDFGLPPSPGQITNVVQGLDCGLAQGDASFDVFFELDVPSLGETWLNVQPLHLERPGLRRLPPSDEPYENPFVEPVLLVNQGNGQPRATVLYERHHADPPFPDPGPDCVDTRMNMIFDFPPLGLFNQPLTAAGPTTLRRGPAVPIAGGTCCAGLNPCGSDADCGLDDTCCVQNTVGIEMVQMELTGQHPMLGNFTVVESPSSFSVGQTTSTGPQATYPADSFFDVFVELQLQSVPQPLRNLQPVHVAGSGFTGLPGIANIPPDPGSHFTSPPGQNYALQPTGQIRDVDHILDTPRDCDPPPPAGDDCFDSMIHLRITIYNPFCEEDLFIPSKFRMMRDDPQGAGIELIDTLIAKGLIDVSSGCVGPILGQVSASQASGGQVRSLTADEFFPSDSFFDVFLELDTGIGPLTAGPAHMRTTVNALPPDGGEVYYGPGTVIPLFDEDGNPIGEILEVSHSVSPAHECERGCLSTITMGQVPDNVVPPPGMLDPKHFIDVGIPRGAGGVTYDVVRGSLADLHATGGGMGSATCIQEDGGRAIVDATTPGPGAGFFYVARDGFRAFVGTWNAKAPSQVGDRDLKISACAP